MEIENFKYCVVSGGTHPLIGESLKKYDVWNKAVQYLNNDMALCQIYNYEIKKALENDLDCLILVHDDVILEENPIPKLEKLFDQFDLVGVAGSSKIELKSPALWHSMGGGFQGGNLHGCVQHLQIQKHPMGMENYIKPKSEFGPYPHKVVMIDGVFMALNRKAIENVHFDMHNPCRYHYYDLSASLDFHLKGGRVGVGDILITHSSPGLREFTEDWKNGENWFLNKYDKE
jgi:hypothetical protein